MIDLQVRDTGNKNERVLKILECYMVYRDVLLKSHSFAKYAVSDGQLKEINRKIAEIRNAFSSITQLRIGPRA